MNALLVLAVLACAAGMEPDWAAVPAPAIHLPNPNARPAGPRLEVSHELAPHLSLTQQAFRYFTARYQGGELARYIGGWANDRPSPATPDNVSAGVYDADTPGLNPWGEQFPVFRHFWNPRGSLTSGIAGGDSAVNSAEKYFTGGVGLDGHYDEGWSQRGTRGDGIIELYGGDKAKAYYYLGQVAHLIQDLSVPAHVHIWPHAFEGSDSYEAFMKTGYRNMAPVPPGPVELHPDVLTLFRSVAEITNDYDAGNDGGSSGVDGEVDRGQRRANGFTRRELEEEGAVLLPLAVRGTAAVFLYFYKKVDNVPPVVKLDIRERGGVLTLTARAEDPVSGVDVLSYRYEADDGGGWKAVPVSFAAEPGKRYSLRASALDAAGNRGVSRPVSVVVPLASARRS